MRTAVAVAALALAAALPVFAQAPAGDSARGQGIYMKSMCYTCHGTAGQGSAYGPALAPHAFPWAGFERQVRHPRSVMPRYPAQAMNDRDLGDLYAYVASIPEGRKAKDIALLKE